MIKMYFKNGDEFEEITRENDLTNPLSTVHDGQIGGIVTTQLYLKNDEVTEWYSNVIVKPIDLSDPNGFGDVIYSESGWGVKLSAGADEPTSLEWEDIEWGNSINMPNIGSSGSPDISTYFPFWYYISCPPNVDAITKTNIVLRVYRTENTI